MRDCFCVQMYCKSAELVSSFFSRAASPERSDLSSHYGICMYVWMWSCGNIFHKGIFFDTRFGLIHVQTGKKKFCKKFVFAKFFLRPFHRIS